MLSTSIIETYSNLDVYMLRIDGRATLVKLKTRKQKD